MSIRANTTSDVSSVKFGFDDIEFFRIENVVPYALFGDYGGDYLGDRIAKGIHIIKATPWSEDFAQGDQGMTTSLEFQFIVPSIESFTLIDTRSDTPISEYDPIIQGSTISLSYQKARFLSVRAKVSHPVGSVKFELDSQEMQTENVEPYALFGDIDGDFAPGQISIGSHRLVATPFSEINGQGIKGTPLELNFSLDYNDSSKATESLSTYPNPFNPSTQINYSLSKQYNVNLSIFDLLGRKIATLVDESQVEGTYQYSFSAEHYASGLYVVRLMLNNRVVSTENILFSK